MKCLQQSVSEGVLLSNPPQYQCAREGCYNTWIVGDAPPECIAVTHTGARVARVEEILRRFDFLEGSPYMGNPEASISEYDALVDIVTTYGAECEAKGRRSGYEAGLADGTGKPLLAIEQMREKGVKAERERIMELLEDTIQKERWSGAPHAINTLITHLTTQSEGNQKEV